MPSKPTQACGKLLPLSAPGGQEDLGPEASSPAPKASGGHEVPGSTPKTQGPVPEASSESLTGQSAEGDFSVDFEKIYTYLSSVSRGGQVPELSAAGEEGGAGTLGAGSLVASPALPTHPLSILHQSPLWSLTCSWRFLRSCPVCPAPPWLNTCRVCTDI